MKSRRKLLEERIEQLEIQQRRDFLGLKEQLETTIESLKPIHIVSDLIENSLTNKKFKHSLFKIGLSSTASFLVSKILFKNSKSLLGNVTSTVIQSTINKVIHNITSKN